MEIYHNELPKITMKDLLEYVEERLKKGWSYKYSIEFYKKTVGIKFSNGEENVRKIMFRSSDQ